MLEVLLKEVTLEDFQCQQSNMWEIKVYFKLANMIYSMNFTRGNYLWQIWLMLVIIKTFHEMNGNSDTLVV